MQHKILEQFLMLSEHLHFGRASNALNISISALSRNVRQLESTVGTSLFLRDNRSVTLTAKGEQFQIYAQDALARWTAIRHTLADSGDPLTGSISVYCSVTASYSILQGLLHGLRAEQPGVEIKLHTGDPEHAIARVLEGEENIAITAEPASLPRRLVFKPVTVSPLLFIAPARSNPDTINFPIPTSAKELAGIPMILSEEGVARRHVNAWFRQQGINPTVYAQVAGNEAIVSMVSLGLGVGVVPEIVLRNSPLIDNIDVLAITPSLSDYHVGLVTLKRTLSDPVVRAFWDLAVGE